MFCKNCGAQFDDSQAFCPSCGTPVAPSAPAGAASQPFTPSKNGNSKLPLVIVAAAVIVVLVIIVAVLTSGGQKKAVKNMFKYLEDGNTAKLLTLEAPKAVAEEMIEEAYDNYNVDFEEFVEVYDSAFETFWAGLKDEGKVKVSYEIKNCENLNKLDKLKKDMKDWDIKDLEDFVDNMDDMYGDYDFDADKIKSAYAIEYKYTIEVDKDKAIKGSDLTIAYKYKGDWYLLSTVDLNTLVGSLDDEDYEEVIEDTRDEIKELFKTSKNSAEEED
ncbi:MAG: zinc ribbon domain-containing protein [Lachnospiraceae bacterium]